MLGLDGKQPSNLIAIVHAPATELRVPALAQAYYRVVAVDAAGTRGGASRMAGKKTHIVCAIMKYTKPIVLPRQARDKHRENSKREVRFLERYPTAGCVLLSRYDR
eukprot:COSAG06_NODE_19055_length_855_cov_2.514550_1_plen_106_part_00